MYTCSPWALSCCIFSSDFILEGINCPLQRLTALGLFLSEGARVVEGSLYSEDQTVQRPFALAYEVLDLKEVKGEEMKEMYRNVLKEMVETSKEVTRLLTRNDSRRASQLLKASTSENKKRLQDIMDSDDSGYPSSDDEPASPAPSPYRRYRAEELEFMFEFVKSSDAGKWELCKERGNDVGLFQSKSRDNIRCAFNDHSKKKKKTLVARFFIIIIHSSHLFE
jgi:hypothetical protein